MHARPAFSFLRLFTTLAACGACASAGNALAVTLSLGGTAGYESIRTEYGDDNLGGLGFTGIFQADVTKLAGSTGLLMGADLGFFSTEGENNDLTTEFTQMTFGPFLGLAVPVAPRFNLQVTLGYQFGFNGELEREITKNTSINEDTESFGRVVHEWRGVFDVTSNIGVGFGLGWSAGSVQLADEKFFKGEIDYRSWGLKGVFLYTL